MSTPFREPDHTLELARLQRRVALLERWFRFVRAVLRFRVQNALPWKKRRVRFERFQVLNDMQSLNSGPYAVDIVEYRGNREISRRRAGSLHGVYWLYLDTNHSVGSSFDDQLYKLLQTQKLLRAVSGEV